MILSINRFEFHTKESRNVMIILRVGMLDFVVILILSLYFVYGNERRDIAISNMSNKFFLSRL